MLNDDVHTVVSYIYNEPSGKSNVKMRVFDFKIDTSERWNVMMSFLAEDHPETKNSIVILFMKELKNNSLI